MIDFYASPLPDPTGFGQGRTYIGSTPLTTDANGNARFGSTFAATVPAGQVIAATATMTLNAPSIG